MSSQLKKLTDLVVRFKAEEAKFASSSSSYQETEARVEFIDPLFSLLGWNMDNSIGLTSGMRDVMREESQLTETSAKKPDYTFRIATVRKFFTEAKRPSVDIRTHKESALQTRSYGYTAGLPISILTNFRTFRVYDTRLEPNPADDANVGLLISIEYEDFLSRLDDLIAIFGRDQVAGGSIELKFGITPSGTIPVNASFLNRINRWRVRIAQDLHTRYPTLTCDELSDFAQKVINRIIFIRMCEDRGIEGEEVLRKVARKRDFVELRVLFKRMNDRYNTGLFDVSQDRLQDIYEVDAELFLGIVDEVYAPNSPYSFSVLNADFLGQVYELFLGQRLALDTATGAVVLEDKPAYDHREIVTTPQPLVEEVVRRALDSKFKQLDAQGQLTIEAIMSLRVLDVAVGSGRFLLRVFDELVSIAIKTLLNTDGQPNLYRITDNTYRLSFQIKRKLLENCLFGIDLDYNAVEVARFSMVVRLLEEETGDTLPSGRKILPDLDKNILHGNTVVGADFPITSGPVFKQTLPLDWSPTELSTLFDIVVGNPPYVKTENMVRISPDELKYYKSKYKTPYRQFDKYFVFIELALSKMKAGAWFGMVIPNKWITIGAGTKLRGLLSKHGMVSEIVDFGNEKLFEGKSAYVCMLILTKDGTDQFTYRHVNSYQNFLAAPKEKGLILPSTLLNTFGSNAWVLPSSNEEASVLAKLTANSIPLSNLADVANGIQTSANDVFLIPQFVEKENFIEFKKGDTLWEIEKAITRPFINDSGRVVSYQPIEADALMIFPYELSSSGFPVPIDPATMARDYPYAFAYLSAHTARLLKRGVNPPPKPGVFYAYGRHQALEAVFSAPKIIYSVNQRGDKYTIDNVGVSYASGGTAGEVAVLNPRNGYALEFLLGLLNQRAVEFFARKRGSAFGGGWFARGSAVLDDIPVPILDLVGNATHKAIHDDIVRDVCGLIQIQDDLKTASGRGRQSLISRRAALTQALESKFNAVWGFTDEVNALVLPGDG